MTQSHSAAAAGGPYYAAVLDDAAAESSPFLMALAIRKALAYEDIGDLPDDSPALARAAAWAFEYHTKTIDGSGRRRLSLIPAHDFGDRTVPPRVAQAPDDVKRAWAELAPLANHPAVRGRLYLILWELGGTNRRESATLAIAAHFDSAANWSREADAINDLVIATRLSRSISDDTSAARSLESCLDIAEGQLQGESPRPGTIIRALDHVASEPGAPARVDALLEMAFDRITDVRSRDQVLEIIRTRCTTDGCQRLIWERRVDNYLAQANIENSKIMRSTRLQDALRIAEQSAMPHLRERAANALQAIRNDEIDEMIHTEASSRHFEEEFERYRDQLVSGGSWQEAFLSFARCGPLSGRAERNRDFVRMMQAEHPLAALFPVQLIGPDKLPFYRATTDEERFEFDLVRHEVTMMNYSLSALTEALRAVPARFPTPFISELAEFFNQWPGIDQTTAMSIAKTLHRLWSGDGEAAAATFLPRIEAQIRELVLQSERGIFRLQQQNTPGQFAGLGVLLPILAEEYDLDESHERFLGALLTKPGGHNLRNQWSHGLMPDLGPGAAALLIHAALFIGLLDRRPAAAAAPQEDD